MACSPEEKDLIDEARRGLNAAKAGLRDARKAMTKMMDIQHAAGNREAYAAAYAVRCAIGQAFAEVETAHSVASKEVLACFPDDDLIVIFGPGGGR